MAVCNDEAIVLRLSDYSESSQIVTLFTPGDGLVRVLGKGTRRGTKKRFAVGLDLLEYGDVSYARPRRDATLGMLAEWVQRDAFSGLRRDSFLVHAGLYAAELAQSLTEEYDAHASIFVGLHELLSGLAAASGDGSDASAVEALVRFQAVLLRALGYAPNLRTCNVCGSPREAGAVAFFSSAAGGLICRNCEQQQAEKRRVSACLIDAGRSVAEPAEWFDLLHYHLTQIAGKRFRVGGMLQRAMMVRYQGGAMGENIR